jgi:Acetoacetate decarboxylase (ADC)/SnoaL-like domain
MAKNEGKGQKFIPHANVPGPARLDVERADFSGTVHTDPMYVADRQAIINHVTAYSYLIDEGRWDEWFALFSDDLSFETTAPEVGTLVLKGKAPFKEFVKHRYVIPGKTSKGVRRHTQGNVHVALQTATTAKVRTYMLISSVPEADKLQTLTTGTYNADLEKRNGNWIITRWYIEVDAPLSPSPFPEGFTAEEVQYSPDPSTAMPGAGPVAVPVQGQITLKNHPFSMGSMYENEPEWTWSNVEFVIVDYLTDAKSAAAFLPEQCTTLPIPELPGYSAVKQIWAHYPESSFGPYNELMPVIPCLHHGELFLYVPFIYVDSDRAMAGGREIGGWPKKMGHISVDRVGNEYRCTFEREGKRLASASMHIGSKLFSTPLPADKPVSLPFPYNMTLMLPPPTGKPQETIPLPSATIKLIPGVGPGNSPVVARLIGAPWQLKGTFYGGSGASSTYGRSENDPMYRLPILKILGSTYFEGGMSLALKDIKVLDDMLKTQPGSLGKKVVGQPA